MNLLDSVLCTSNAQEYANTFKQHGIDVSTLKLLNDEDLQLLGITDKEKRNLIIQHAAHLQIPKEKQIPINIDQKYIELVLAQMSIHLMKHLAALSIALNRPDVVICNIKLGAAAHCLKNCVSSLNKQLNTFEEKITVKQKKKFRTKETVLPIAIIISFGLITYKVVKLLF